MGSGDGELAATKHFDRTSMEGVVWALRIDVDDDGGGNEEWHVYGTKSRQC